MATIKPMTRSVPKAIFTLVYTSTSVYLLSDKELDEILAASLRNNLRLGITGMLLYYEGAFMQALEGDKAAVQTVFTSILKDVRHHRIITLLEAYWPKRSFPSWSMGFKRLDASNVSQIEGFHDFAEVDKFLEYYKDKPQLSLTLLANFCNAFQE